MTGGWAGMTEKWTEMTVGFCFEFWILVIGAYLEFVILNL
jgi:hypothetical protein